MTNIVEKYTQVYGSPFLTGVFLGVNAIKDAALYVDGPDCVFYKSDLIFKTHDLNSRLKDPSVDTKLYFSGVMPNKMVRGYDEKIKNKLSFINKNSNFNLGVVTCMPVTGLLATQYNSLYSDFDKDFIFIPSFTDKFYLDGYNIFLKELAKNMTFDTSKEKLKKHISIVGFLFDRNEGDSIGNIEEIKRILSLIGVSIDCIWLNGGEYKDLKNIEDSELIVIFPYGEAAGKVLSKKLGVDILETELPFGLSGTIKFLEDIGGKLNISSELLKDIISKEIKIIKEKIDLLDEKVFLSKNYIYAGDPFLEKGVKDIGILLGLNHLITYPYNGTKNLNISDLNYKVDIVIGNSEFNVPIENCTYFEVGFPSYNTHFLVSTPYMGFKGILYFTQRLYNELSKDNLH